MIYDKFPEKARELADIDIIGVVSENDRTAVMLAGAKVLKKYLLASVLENQVRLKKKSIVF